MEEELSGGRSGRIIKSEDKVIRPANVWTPYVHRFLEHLHKCGADFVPKPYGINENGQEILSFVKGEVYNYPLPNEFLQDKMLICAAQLLRKFHDCGTGYMKYVSGDEPWMLKAELPII